MIRPAADIRRIEMKYRLPSDLSAEVKRWARENLGRDPHADLDDGDAYQIHSTYFDTPERDLYDRTGVIGRTKFRLRRYGNDASVWLESKRKRRMVVRKRRTRIDRPDVETGPLTFDDDATLIGHPPDHPADWFLAAVTRRRLVPTTRLSYRRFVRGDLGPDGSAAGGVVRLTIDTDMLCRPAAGWSVDGRDVDGRGAEGDPGSGNAAQPFGDDEILELKFDNTMPAVFKELLSQFPITPTGFSKYRVGTSRLSPPVGSTRHVESPPGHPSSSVRVAAGA